MSARPAELAPQPDDAGPGPDAKSVVGLDSLVMRNVQVSLRAKLGEVEMSVEELLGLKAGAVLKLDRTLGEPVELFLNDALVARGEIVAVDDNFGIRLITVAQG